MLKFEAGSLGNIFLDIKKNKFSGAVYLKLMDTSESLNQLKVFTFRNGAVTYGGVYLPKPHEFIEKIGKSLNLKAIDAALSLASKKVKNPLSIREHLEFCVQIELFSWQDVEKVIRNQIILNLEQALSHAGVLKLSASTSFDLAIGPDHHGLSWEVLTQEINQRQQAWLSLAPTISSKNVIPIRIETAETTIQEPWVKQHLAQWIDGKRTLGDIAARSEIDPLELARGYFRFFQLGWLTFTHIPAPRALSQQTSVNPARPSLQKRSTILSVDDSPIVQAMIKRAIGTHYNLLLANNAMDALNLLNQYSVDLLLLDVTMPDIDGLELCRTIRNIGKFRDLPVIMLTAKDGMFNKIKGQMAGSTLYLTKPVDPPKLFEALHKYLPQEPKSEQYLKQSSFSEQPT